MRPSGEVAFETLRTPHSAGFRHPRSEKRGQHRVSAELVRGYPRIAIVSVHPDVTATTLVGNPSLLSSKVMIYLTDLSQDKSSAAERVRNQP